MIGVSYRAIFAVGLRGNPYAAARRPAPKDSPPVGRRYSKADRVVRMAIDTSPVEMAIGECTYASQGCDRPHRVPRASRWLRISSCRTIILAQTRLHEPNRHATPNTPNKKKILRRRNATGSLRIPTDRYISPFTTRIHHFGLTSPSVLHFRPGPTTRLHEPN